MDFEKIKKIIKEEIEQTAGEGQTAVATENPIIQRSATDLWLYKIPAIDFVKKGTADEYIQLIGKKDVESKRRAGKLYQGYTDFIVMGRTEEEARDKAEKTWKEYYPDVYLITEHLPEEFVDYTGDTFPFEPEDENY